MKKAEREKLNLEIDRLYLLDNTYEYIAETLKIKVSRVRDRVTKNKDLPRNRYKREKDRAERISKVNTVFIENLEYVPMVCTSCNTDRVVRKTTYLTYYHNSDKPYICKTCKCKSAVIVKQLKFEVPVNGIKSIPKNELYKHYKNEKLYQLVGIVKMQIKNEWVEAILYHLHGDKKLQFVRPISDFLNKFELWKVV